MFFSLFLTESDDYRELIFERTICIGRALTLYYTWINKCDVHPAIYVEVSLSVLHLTYVHNIYIYLQTC
jgi:hypothetical protein